MMCTANQTVKQLTANSIAASAWTHNSFTSYKNLFGVARLKHTKHGGIIIIILLCTKMVTKYIASFL